jgi:hypothetical protein
LATHTLLLLTKGMMVQMVVICKHSTTWSRKQLNGKSTSTALAMLAGTGAYASRDIAATQ